MWFMQIPVFVLMMLCILPILCGWVSGYYRHKQFGVVDNKYPRLQNANLEKAGARAVAAQMNAWEALALYSAALLAVTISGVPVEQYAQLTLVLLVCRILHALFYLVNQDILRSITFVGAYGICIYMFIIAL
jgi:uncharacterized MAPEG superfamily protein